MAEVRSFRIESTPGVDPSQTISWDCPDDADNIDGFTIGVVQREYQPVSRTKPPFFKRLNRAFRAFWFELELR